MAAEEEVQVEELKEEIKRLQQRVSDLEVIVSYQNNPGMAYHPADAALSAAAIQRIRQRVALAQYAPAPEGWVVGVDLEAK